MYKIRDNEVRNLKTICDAELGEQAGNHRDGPDDFSLMLQLLETNDNVLPRASWIVRWPTELCAGSGCLEAAYASNSGSGLLARRRCCVTGRGYVVGQS